jgi:hypothetical protein
MSERSYARRVGETIGGVSLGMGSRCETESARSVHESLAVALLGERHVAGVEVGVLPITSVHLDTGLGPSRGVEASDRRVHLGVAVAGIGPSVVGHHLRATRAREQCGRDSSHRDAESTPSHAFIVAPVPLQAPISMNSMIELPASWLMPTWISSVQRDVNAPAIGPRPRARSRQIGPRLTVLGAPLREAPLGRLSLAKLLEESLHPALGLDGTLTACLSRDRARGGGGRVDTRQQAHGRSGLRASSSSQFRVRSGAR